MDSIPSFNALAELASLCPTEDSMAGDLPESMAAEWSNGAPTLRPNAIPAGDSKLQMVIRPSSWV